MASAKLFYLFIVSCATLAHGAPVDDSENNAKQQIIQQFVELVPDKLLRNLLNFDQRVASIPLIRNRRDELDDIEEADSELIDDLEQDLSPNAAGPGSGSRPGSTNTDTPSDGFFDRAARFVLEIVQRFMKWINTDN